MQSYEAQESDGSQEEHTVVLENNEELFGIYGVKDDYDHFTSFGLIAKVLRNVLQLSKLMTATPADTSDILSPFKLTEVSPVKFEMPKSKNRRATEMQTNKKQVSFTITP